MTKQGNRKARFQFMHRAENFEWTNYCYERLKYSLPLSPPVYKKVNDPRIKLCLQPVHEILVLSTKVRKTHRQIADEQN